MKRISESERIAEDRDLIVCVMTDYSGLTEAEAIDIIEYFGGLGSTEYIERAHAARKSAG